MTCDRCHKETAHCSNLAYYRIGNADIGYGDIALVGCRYHVKLALDRLNDAKGNTGMNQDIQP